MHTTTAGIWVALTTIFITSSAWASKWPDAKSAHEAGRAAYEAKRYEDAAEAFKATHEHDPNPVLLVNVAESYKRAGDCVQALAYYEQFLKAVPNGDLHITITGRAAALRPECPAAASLPAPAPTPEPEPGSEARLANSTVETAPSAPPVAPAPVPPPVAAEAEQPVDPAEPGPKAAQPNWQIGLEAGVSNARWGPVSTGVQPSVQITADRIWWVGKLGFGVSVAGQWSRSAYKSATFAPEAYEDSATILAATASAQVRLQLIDWLAIRLDLGGGLTRVSGFEAWNELGANGAATDGGVTLGTARAGLGADIPLTGPLGLRVTALALSYSPAPTEAREGVSQVLTLGGGLGVAYGF